MVEEAIHRDWERRQPVRIAPNRPAIKTAKGPFKSFMKLSSRIISTFVLIKINLRLVLGYKFDSDI